MRSLRSVGSGLVLLASLFAARAAHAQIEADTGFAIDRFDPAPAGDRFFGVASPTVVGKKQLAALLVADYGHAPFVMRRPDGEEIGKVVGAQLYFHANASLALFDRLLIHLNVPFATVNKGDSPMVGPTTFPSPSGAAMGDVRIGARMRFYGEIADPFQVSIGLALWLPTGKREAYTGDGRARFAPSVLFGGRIGDFVWSATTGITLRDARVVLDNRVQNELTFGLGAGLLLLDDKLQVGPELYAATAAFGEAKPFEKKTSTRELLFGVKYFPKPFVIGLAAGTGFGAGLGTPDMRVVGLVGYAPGEEPAPPPPLPPPPPPPRDTDGDGVIDLEDACPTAQGIKTTDPKTNGCPDQDADGIPDHLDACPAAAGVRDDDAKKNGCPADKDGDGVPDAVDACPDTAGVQSDDPTKNGCPPDKDADGVPDAVDACPDVAGVKSDDPTKNGCPPDKDGDGIVDAVDACPDEPGQPDPDPKRNGCPKVTLTAKSIVLNEQVLFETGKATILPASDALLTQIAKVLNDHPELKKLSVEGHTDDKGQANYTLSVKRAEAVVKWLVDHGVEKERLQSKGFGSSKPVGDNKTEEGREKNRRVELKILDPKPPADPPAAKPPAKK